MTKPVQTVAPALPGAPSALRIFGASKRFGDHLVLDGVDFDLAAGEVHALLGENGAGKSTLMNILSGIYTADAGRIEIEGAAVSIAGPSAAVALGIGMVHQHFKLVQPFTGRENLHLAAAGLPLVPRRAVVEEQIAAVVKRSALDVNLDVPVARLSVAEQQRIEILKALLLGARILVLDEPTAVLTDAEADRLLALVRDLAAQGHAIIFITHKLREVLAAGDRVSVLRRGRMVLASHAVEDVTRDDLSRAMIGDQETTQRRRSGSTPGPVLLEVTGLGVRDGGAAYVSDAGLSLRAGEIHGLAGVGGNGQRELAEAILGLRAATGQVALEGRDLTGLSVAARRRLGLRYVPADRSADALAPNVSLAENLAATLVRTGALGRRMVWPSRVRQHAAAMVQSYGIAGATGGGRRPVRLLSGGNAQKVVLARELDRDARLIIAHSPTRGLDVAACAYVHERLLEAVARGAGVLLISEDLEEVLALSDRISVISRGRIATTPDGRPDRAQIGELMLGHA
ncbi:ABC transporter ATP-binding protein [Marinibacterium profundimaris]|uniref:ABC transporter ATP-binding protein n=1 Tax=Marinibacterium profundimaris TaxID=1679460 RepID=UPI000B5271B6|nr:ABC transporter ATP-binding protein [Marinibacterium profundimaris]